MPTLNTTEIFEKKRRQRVFWIFLNSLIYKPFCNKESQPGLAVYCLSILINYLHTMREKCWWWC